ncbi:MAG: hypothetical protein HC830_03480 [Bacteroidetes bacterium]|nr:hypothetical protein [Bacteroidota bacterium]
MLSTWLLTDDPIYSEVARESFEFHSSRFFSDFNFQHMDNSFRGSITKLTDKLTSYASINTKTEPMTSVYPVERPTDIAFCVITLSKFYLVCKDNNYYHRMNAAFNWFLGNNRLNMMLYNSATGSCYDGLTNGTINTGQSAGSTLSYTLSRLVVEKYKFKDENHILF